MSTSSLGVSNTSLRSTSLGCSSPSSSITTSLRISSRHDFPFRRLRINLAATSSPVSLWMHFLTTANFPLRKKKKSQIQKIQKQQINFPLKLRITKYQVTFLNNDILIMLIHSRCFFEHTRKGHVH